MHDVIVYTLMSSGMLQLLMAAYAWGRRNEPAAKPLILVFVLGAVWAFAYGLEIASGDLAIKILMTKIYWTAASFGPLIFLWITFEHLEITHLLTRGRLALLLVPSFTIIALAWTMPYHNLLLYNFRVEDVGPLDILEKNNGILFAPVLLASQAIALIAYYFLIRSFAYTSRVKRRQSIAILLALLTPFIANMPYILGISPIKGFDFTPHALVISSGLFAFAIFRYRWLDIIPLARTALVEAIPVGVVVLDSKYRIVDINPSAQHLLQLTHSMVGHEAHTALAKFTPAAFLSTDMALSKTEFRMQRDEDERHLEVHTLPLKNREDQFNGYIIMFQDITERKQAESAIQYANERLQMQLTEIESLHAQLHEQAFHDPLTGLFNRGYLNDTLDRETHRAERHQHPLSLLMIEIDSFKRFNDNYGHEAGDVTLQQVAELIQANTRTDDTACRFGGDEFTLIMPETTLESARQCAERLRASA